MSRCAFASTSRGLRLCRCRQKQRRSTTKIGKGGRRARAMRGCGRGEVETATNGNSHPEYRSPRRGEGGDGDATSRFIFLVQCHARRDLIGPCYNSIRTI